MFPSCSCYFTSLHCCTRCAASLQRSFLLLQLLPPLAFPLSGHEAPLAEACSAAWGCHRAAGPARGPPCPECTAPCRPMARRRTACRRQGARPPPGGTRPQQAGEAVAAAAAGEPEGAAGVRREAAGRRRLVQGWRAGVLGAPGRGQQGAARGAGTATARRGEAGSSRDRTVSAGREGS